MLLVLVVTYIFVAFNDTFWTKGLEVFGGHIGQLILFYAAIFLLTMAFFALFALPYILRPFLAFVLILGAVTSYYMDNLGVIIDRDMIQNVVTTTLTESKHLLTAAFILHVAVFGALPALVVLLFFRVKPQKRWMAIISPVATCAVCLALAVGLLMSNFKTYSSVLRERKDLMSSYQPGAPIVAAIRYAKMMTRSVNVVVAPIGEDARKGAVYQTNSKPTLTIIVAGETARSQNFSLNGYGVDTNPELSKRDVVSFTNVTSCGTATATSLPCMFSKYTRDDYSYDKGISTESLLDVLAHAGFHVEWWDNNTGDKGVAARLPVQFFANSDNPEHCSAGECDDGILIEQLRSYLPTITQDTVLVLHQIGSHGPAYYLRYPEAFEKFKPACRTAEFKDCTAA
ncbi:MAG: phosphoethanolamine transferase domain-containing protein, partial [Albidovulum sp.]